MGVDTRCCASKKILSLVSLVGSKAPGHMYYCTDKGFTKHLTQTHEHSNHTYTSTQHTKGNTNSSEFQQTTHNTQRVIRTRQSFNKQHTTRHTCNAHTHNNTQHTPGGLVKLLLKIFTWQNYNLLVSIDDE